MISTPQLHTVALLCVLGALAGCGCFYDGEIVDVGIQPDPGCLDLEAYGECAGVVLSGTNGCEDPLLFPARGDWEEVSFAPGESFYFDTVGAYGEEMEDEDNCYSAFAIAAFLGEEPLLLEFTIAHVNRGAALPCS